MQAPENYAKKKTKKKKRPRRRGGAGTDPLPGNRNSNTDSETDHKLGSSASAQPGSSPAREFCALSPLPTPNGALLKCTSARWIPSPREVGVSEVGSVIITARETCRNWASHVLTASKWTGMKSGVGVRLICDFNPPRSKMWLIHEEGGCGRTRVTFHWKWMSILTSSTFGLLYRLLPSEQVMEPGRRKRREKIKRSLAFIQ